ncbi:hypothetical protein SOV_37650 [Sporomusa ovata DSM 2662]|uniref:DUF2442 domain-containing protein n=1 Tax=Sporomusa ovata TaxID=2378 RepID=A0A0U1KS59_9FIRM|nr:DUF2442 domain-containing protein [Sporomusa ovata]EQB26154.1 hypothetical protein SOV_3c00280 [Sporomusa ovata DSM 2662]CQR70227.1 hypothetical protein SpAn4DRAFT_1196 [Sporomusa ovata]
MGKITEVTFDKDYLVAVRFDNNHLVMLDMKQKLYTARFSELRDEQVFQAVKTDGKSIYWPGGIAIAISEIIEIVAT